jgi:glutamine cyclotransferase
VSFSRADCIGPGGLDASDRSVRALYPAACLAWWLLFAPLAAAAGPRHTPGESPPDGRSCSALTQDRYPYPSSVSAPAQAAPSRPYRVVARYPHDRDAFTEGLVFYRGQLYESTGIRGRSSVRRVDLTTGRLQGRRGLNRKLFGEGLAVADNRLVQLTWQSGSGFLYNPVDLSQTGTFTFSGEGWGVTTAGGELVISDGSAKLQFLNRADYRPVRSLMVTEQGRPVEGLNELEMVDGVIYANVYPTDCIAQIDPQSGHLLGWVDLRGLMPVSERPDGSAVANGIAYRPETRELFVTGKFWPYIYQLKLLKTDARPGKQIAWSGTIDQRL